MTFMKLVPPHPWTDTIPEKKGLLIFDNSGALLGGGVVQEIEDEETLISKRWIVPFGGEDWTLRESNTYLTEFVTERTCVMIQATMSQIGNVWRENEASWSGRLEGTLHVLNHLGVEVKRPTEDQDCDTDEKEGNGESNIIGL